MRSLYRPLGQGLALIRAMDPGQWIVALLSFWLGSFLNRWWDHSGVIGWTVGGLILTLTLVGRFTDYTLFIPEPNGFKRLASAETPAAVKGEATGDFYCWAGYHVKAPLKIIAADVLVRWMEAEDGPPHLAVLRPADQHPQLKEPLQNSEEWSAWYPGVEIMEGWVFMDGEECPGLRLRYYGKQLLLAVRKEEHAAAFAEALRQT